MDVWTRIKVDVMVFRIDYVFRNDLAHAKNPEGLRFTEKLHGKNT